MTLNDKAIKELAQWVNQYWQAPDPMPILAQHAPNLTAEDAYRVQQARMALHCETGDRIIGYKAALTSRAMQQKSGIDHPVLGTLLASKYVDHTQPISLNHFLTPTLEPELAIWLCRDLKGPCQPHDVIAAIGGVMASFELGDMRQHPDSQRDLPETICFNTFNGGHTWSLHSFPVSHCDWRVEGMNLSLNGVFQNQATCITVLGNPLHAVSFMANQLAAWGETIKAGMILLTGSIVSSISLKPGDVAQADYSHLGQLTVQFE